MCSFVCPWAAVLHTLGGALWHSVAFGAHLRSPHLCTCKQARLLRNYKVAEICKGTDFSCLTGTSMDGTGQDSQQQARTFLRGSQRKISSEWKITSESWCSLSCTPCNMGLCCLTDIPCKCLSDFRSTNTIFVLQSELGNSDCVDMAVAQSVTCSSVPTHSAGFVRWGEFVQSTYPSGQWTAWCSADFCHQRCPPCIEEGPLCCSWHLLFSGFRRQSSTYIYPLIFWKLMKQCCNSFFARLSNLSRPSLLDIWANTSFFGELRLGTPSISRPWEALGALNSVLRQWMPAHHWDLLKARSQFLLAADNGRR